MYSRAKYYDEDFMYAWPFSPNGRGIDVKSMYEPTYSFTYGSEINLIFQISEKFKEYLFTITIYDSNFCPICHSENNQVDSENKIYMKFSEEDSRLIFQTGTYYCGIQTSNSCTIQAPNQCMIRIV